MFSPRSLVFGALGLMLAGTSSAMQASNSLLLNSVAESLALPMYTWSANGTHHAKGYTTKDANETDVKGMHEDCENINLNRKLATDFRSDVLGPGAIGFFYKCERISHDTNLYWFTISSGEQSQIDQLCDPNQKYPIVYDSQHNTWFIDEPFECTQRTSPSVTA
ncbi:hypothetical protein N7456_007754 [Penicillium angulare]|uniref:AA1-like domain-containing protein n=1 Tax=Penicillium angulare TaxID=116970 RepID=A0A9W9K8J4_9EURO|nr:hypothetical protein N7456_007754 [Penicillium angulare]